MARTNARHLPPLRSLRPLRETTVPSRIPDYSCARLPFERIPSPPSSHSTASRRRAAIPRSPSLGCIRAKCDSTVFTVSPSVSAISFGPSPKPSKPQHLPLPIRERRHAPLHRRGLRPGEMPLQRVLHAAAHESLALHQAAHPREDFPLRVRFGEISACPGPERPLQRRRILPLTERQHMHARRSRVKSRNSPSPPRMSISSTMISGCSFSQSARASRASPFPRTPRATGAFEAWRESPPAAEGFPPQRARATGADRQRPGDAWEEPAAKSAPACAREGAFVKRPSQTHGIPPFDEEVRNLSGKSPRSTRRENAGSRPGRQSAPPLLKSAAWQKPGKTTRRRGLAHPCPVVRHPCRTLREQSPAIRHGSPAIREQSPAIRHRSPVVHHACRPPRHPCRIVRHRCRAIRHECRIARPTPSNPRSHCPRGSYAISLPAIAPIAFSPDFPSSRFAAKSKS